LLCWSVGLGTALGNKYQKGGKMEKRGLIPILVRPTDGVKNDPVQYKNWQELIRRINGVADIEYCLIKEQREDLPEDPWITIQWADPKTLSEFMDERLLENDTRDCLPMLSVLCKATELILDEPTARLRRIYGTCKEEFMENPEDTVYNRTLVWGELLAKNPRELTGGYYRAAIGALEVLCFLRSDARKDPTLAIETFSKLTRLTVPEKQEGRIVEIKQRVRYDTTDTYVVSRNAWVGMLVDTLLRIRPDEPLPY